MFQTWDGLLTLLIFSIFIVLVAVLLNRRLKIGSQFPFAVFMALASFQILFSIQGGIVPIPATLTQIDKFLLSLSMIFTFNAMTKIIQWVLIETVLKRRLLDVPPFIINLLGWVATIIAAFLVVQIVYDIELTTFLVSSTVVTALIGLSLQQVMTSLFVGIILQMETPFHIGDWIEIDGYEGKLEHLGWRTLAIRTRLDNLVVFANSDVADGRIVNYSRPKLSQGIEAEIIASYPNPPGKVKAALEEMIRNVDGVLDDPPPLVLVTGFGGSSMHYKIRYWINDYEKRDLIQDHVYTFTWYALTRVGAGDPFGISDIHILSADDDVKARAKQHRTIFVTLRNLPIFSVLSDQQIELLSQSAILNHYTVDEILVHQGTQGDSLFVIIEGTTSVWFDLTDGENPPVRIDEKGAGEFFGEMSLLTGEARTATVRADTETTVITIGSVPLRQIVTTDPTLIGQFVDALEQNASNLETQKAAIENRAAEDHGYNRLVRRISHFLGL